MPPSSVNSYQALSDRTQPAANLFSVLTKKATQHRQKKEFWTKSRMAKRLNERTRTFVVGRLFSTYNTGWNEKKNSNTRTYSSKIEKRKKKPRVEYNLSWDSPERQSTDKDNLPKKIWLSLFFVKFQTSVSRDSEKRQVVSHYMTHLAWSPLKKYSSENRIMRNTQPPRTKQTQKGKNSISNQVHCSHGIVLAPAFYYLWKTADNLQNNTKCLHHTARYLAFLSLFCVKSVCLSFYLFAHLLLHIWHPLQRRTFSFLLVDTVYDVRYCVR